MVTLGYLVDEVMWRQKRRAGSRHRIKMEGYDDGYGSCDHSYPHSRRILTDSSGRMAYNSGDVSGQQPSPAVYYSSRRQPEVNQPRLQVHCAQLLVVHFSRDK